MTSVSPHGRPPRFQFGLAALLLTMLVIGVAAAGFAGMADRGDLRAAAIVFVLVAPMGILMLLSGFQSLQHWLAKRRQARTLSNPNDE